VICAMSLPSGGRYRQQRSRVGRRWHSSSHKAAVKFHSARAI
jgi:hypothetical protein